MRSVIVNKLHMPALLVIMLAMLQAPQASAETTARLEAGSDLIAGALSNPSLSDDDILRKIVADLRQKLAVCKPSTFLRETALSLCLIGDGTSRYQGKLGEFLRYAVSKNKIDAVEGAILSREAIRIDSVRTDPSTKTLQLVLIGAPAIPDSNSDGIPLPPLQAYRKNKSNFAALRKAKNGEEKLPKDLLDQIAKSFPRQMRGVGEINAEQYFAAQLGRLDLNRLAGLMVSAADFLVRPDARIILYPANHAFASEQLRSIEQQEMDLARSILSEDNDAQRASLQNQLKELEARASALRQDSPADELMLQRAIKSKAIHELILTLARSDLTRWYRDALRDQFDPLFLELNEIDAKLGQLIRTQQISPEDVQRLAFNTLKSDFTGLMQEPPFNQLSLQSADALLAAWVAGDVSSEAMRILSTYPALTETHISVWQKALEVSWNVGKTAMMYFPSTSYIAIAISVFLEVQKATKEAKEKKSNETHIIPLLH